MSDGIKTKESFGSVTITQTRPADVGDLPTALNIIISFEEALKLHLSIGQALAKLNTYNRATTAGKRSALNLCLFAAKNRITVNEDMLPRRASK